MPYYSNHDQDFVTEGLVAKDYLAVRVDGFEAIRSWFDDVDVKDHLRVCGLDTAQSGNLLDCLPP